MPLYEYQCETCEHRFEKIQKFTDPPPDCCPKCGGPVRKLFSSPAIQFKGSGFYITDYAKKSSEGQSGSSAEKSGSSEKQQEKKDKGETSSAKSDSGSTKADSGSGGKSDAGSSSSGDSAPASTTKPKP